MTVHEDLHHEDGTHRSTPKTADGHLLELHEAALERHRADGHRHAPYAWVITRDVLGGKSDRVGAIGPSDATDEMIRSLEDGDGIEFRMSDDDAEAYYLGRFVHVDDAFTELGFGPLDDFGAPDAGCVAIEYRKDDGSWIRL